MSEPTCPRCGDPLDVYDLAGSDARAVGCGSCGFSDVPASHRSDPDDSESWTAAMERFRADTAGDVGRPEVTARQPDPDVPDLADASADDARRLEPPDVTVGEVLGDGNSDEGAGETSDDGADPDRSDEEAERQADDRSESGDGDGDG